MRLGVSIENQALLRLRSNQARKVTVQFRVGTAYQWVVRVLDCSTTVLGRWFRIKPALRPGNPELLVTLIGPHCANHQICYRILFQNQYLYMLYNA